jgi:hypothetical protein
MANQTHPIVNNTQSACPVKIIMVFYPHFPVASGNELLPIDWSEMWEEPVMAIQGLIRPLDSLVAVYR